MTENNQEVVKIKNSLGKNIAAVIHHPELSTKQLAILCPGYLDTKDYLHMVELAKVLADIGYTVVRFDPTGTWESEGDISDYLTSQCLDDVKSILGYMLTRNNYTDVLLGGHSRGGMVSILYAARDSRISLVLGIMPSSGRSIMTTEKRNNWEKTGFNVSYRDIPGTAEQKEFQVPYSHLEDLGRFDDVEEVKNIHIPIILLAGEKDDIVLPEYVREIFDHALDPKTSFILLYGIDHDYRRVPPAIATVNEVIKRRLLVG